MQRATCNVHAARTSGSSARLDRFIMPRNCLCQRRAVGAKTAFASGVVMSSNEPSEYMYGPMTPPSEKPSHTFPSPSSTRSGGERGGPSSTNLPHGLKATVEYLPKKGGSLLHQDDDDDGRRASDDDGDGGGGGGDDDDDDPIGAGRTSATA